MKGKSFLTNLISLYDKMTHLVHEGKAVDFKCLNVSKVFAIVSQSILLEKTNWSWQKYCSVSKKLEDQTQRVVVNGIKST